GFRAQAHYAQRLALTRGEADHLPLVARAASDLRSPSADRVERIVEVGPARHRAGARAEGAGFAFPPGDRRLRGEDLLRAHPFEPVVAGVELPHMLQAHPAPLARAVEARPTRTR